MTTLTLTRRYFTDISTVGDLYLGGEKLCDTLEDTCRKDGVKVHGKTAIPPGTYKLTLALSPKYGRIMPRLKDVPGFEGVLIHAGNSDKSTEGCILVGVYNPSKPDWISNSRATFNTLFERLTKLAANGPLSISVRGGRYQNEAVA